MRGKRFREGRRVSVVSVLFVGCVWALDLLETGEGRKVKWAFCLGLFFFLFVFSSSWVFYFFFVKWLGLVWFFLCFEVLRERVNFK